MDCRQVLQYLDDYLLTGPVEPEREDLIEHVKGCPRCAQEYEAARRSLAAVRLSHKPQTSRGLKERIMNQVIENQVNELSGREPQARAAKAIGFFAWKPALAGGLAVLLLGLAWVHFMPGGDRRGHQGNVAFSLIAQAWAAEDGLFRQPGITHLVNEIVVTAVSDSALAAIRWIPVVMLDATGKTRFHQLTLPAKPGEQYTVTDQSWYDPATGRFVRLLTLNDRPIFASSFDGGAVYTLEAEAGNAPRVSKQPVAAGFKPPESPAAFLGMGAGLPFKQDKTDETLFQELGRETLRDGTEARVVSVAQEGPEGGVQSYWLFKIRPDDNTLAEMEWVAEKQSLLVIRRARSESVEGPGTPWNLAGIENIAGVAAAGPQAGIRPDMVIPDVSLKNMVEKADFETYVFVGDPAWAGKRQIMDILDVASPPHRMFSITYRAADGRHVVLVQSYTYNTMLGPMVKQGRLVYTSPNGFKVWSGPRDQWLAGILLSSSRATIKDAPSKDRTGYVLESPAGTFPALAVNGTMTDEELHGLIDSLAPAKQSPEK